MLLDLAIGAVVILVGILALTFVACIFIPVPYVPTPRRVARKMVELAELRGGETVYDLGAGDGRLLIEAKRKVPGVRAIGIEFVPTIWLLGKLCTWWSGEHVELRLGNALRANLRDADCIFLYLIPSLMKKMEKKFQEELRPGTRIVSYAFSLPGKTPVRKVPVPWLGEEKHLLVYEW